MNPVTTSSQNKFEELIIDCSIDAIVAIDLEEKIIAWNSAAEKMYGKARQDVFGKTLCEVIPSITSDPDTVKAIAHAREGFKSFLPPSKNYFHRMHVDNHFIPLKDGENIVGVMNLVHDVAHRIKSEDELRYLNEELQNSVRRLEYTVDEMSTFTQLSGNRIKNPLREIYTTVEQIIKSDGSKLTNASRAGFRRMQSSIRRMDFLLDDMLKLSSISIAKPNAETDLNVVFKKAIMAMKLHTDKQVDICLNPLCTVEGSEDLLINLFYQLLDNAVKFNDSDVPRIDISCSRVNDQNSSAQPYCCISVKDNGIGFEQGDADNIFKIFTQLREKEYKGSGVGLTIVRKILEAHDGFAEVESEPGQGSVFRCYLKSYPGND